MLGVFPLRGQLIPVYAPDSALGASRAGRGEAGGSEGEGEGEGVVIVVRARDRRIALAVDDVEDVIMMDLSRMRRPPGRATAAQMVLGVLRHGSELVSVVDAAALISLYTAAPAGEEP
jgi:chemotaxis signal transduction protein